MLKCVYFWFLMLRILPQILLITRIRPDHWFLTEYCHIKLVCTGTYLGIVADELPSDLIGTEVDMVLLLPF